MPGTSSSVIPILHVGLGPLGLRLVRNALERPSLKLVAAVDINPALVGQDVGELCGVGPCGVKVAPSLSAALDSVRRGQRPQVAVLTTVSGLAALTPQVVAAAAAGLHVVSTCEELSYPWVTQPALARRLDRACRRRGVACLGVGVNPGFLMDALPSVLTGVCREVQRVRVTRIQDASSRREPFQRKIGAGLTLAQFRAKKRTGTLRHVGLTESMHMLAAALGWSLDRSTETLKPVIAQRPVHSGCMPIHAGMACGVEQIGRGYRGNKAVIEMVFRAAVGEANPHDTVEIVGDPSITSTIAGGVHGDTATCAITLNAVRRIVDARPGLVTMLDLPAPTCR